MYKLEVEGKEFKLSVMPSLNIEEIKQQDGSYQLGEQKWNPIPMSVGDWHGKKDAKLYADNTWLLKDAEIKDGNIHFSSVTII